ncbi:MAG: DUF5668 domain-containing protein [Anaerolineaceae bacterium]|nr:DUF5668 domain-containing protein [Anaerolineaceae bacterium]
MSVFWGGALVLFGILLLLNNLGFLQVNVWGIFWPLVLIFFGIQYLWSYSRRNIDLASKTLSIPLDGASQSEVQIHHGAGRLRLGAGSDPSLLVSGNYSGGIQHNLTKLGNGVRLDLRASGEYMFDWPMFGGNQGHSWDMALNRDISLRLKIETGASESNIDLSELHVTDFRIDTGASSTYLTVPSNAGESRGEIHSGAASMDIRVPEGVAAHIEVKSGLAGIHIDPVRFPQRGNVYESQDYFSSMNRLHLNIETGVGAVDIHS